MGINPAALLEWPISPVNRHYGERDAMLYALGLGIGQDPSDTNQLQFVHERGLVTMPTMAVVLGSPGPWLSHAATGIDYGRVVHGEQHLEIIRPIPTAGTVRSTNRVAGVVDRGVGKGAAIQVAGELRDGSSGQLLARHQSLLVARGDGGFAGNTAQPSAEPRGTIPDREPDLQFVWRTAPQLALIYRLSGDLNPLHVDPLAARRAGFDRPILHGLASFGIAGIAAILALCDGHPDQLRTIGMRFVAPVIPGDTLSFDFWHEGEGQLVFRARAVERDRVVLDRGHMSHGPISADRNSEQDHV